MKNRIIPIGTHTLALALSLLPATAFAQAPTPSPTEQDLEAWRQALSHAPRPATGDCFTAAYPSTQWYVTPDCGRPATPRDPIPHKAPSIGKNGSAGQAPNFVGDTHDYIAVATGGIISSVEGFFPSIDGAMTVTSVMPDPNSDPSGPTFNQNVKSSYKFSLQINSNSFFDVTSTGLCGKNVPCGGWVQFVYMMRLDGSADLYNQYWFWDKIHNNTYCAEAPTTKTAPDTTDIARWKPADQGCYGNSPTINIASQPGKTPIDILKSIRLQGISEGENDHIIVYYEDKAYDSKPFKSPFGKLLSQNWTSAEFNIFGGTSNAPMAKFNIETNIATTLNVKTIVHNNTSNAPTCKLGGTTFEQNNLDLLAGTCSTTAGAAPSITFWESNVPHITVTPNAETGGAISPSTIVELLPGWTAKFTVMPDAGYYIQSVSGCNGSQLSGSSNSILST